jgi:hypothetical protein
VVRIDERESMTPRAGEWLEQGAAARTRRSRAAATGGRVGPLTPSAETAASNAARRWHAARTTGGMSILHRPISLASLALSCSAASTPNEPDTLDTLSSPLSQSAYVDVRDYLTAAEDIDLWYTLTRALKTDFDAICGDTFCEGDYSNYESLGFRCSVEQRTGNMGHCVWIFAASQEEIVPSTGAVEVRAQLWQCSMPLGPHTPVATFLHALSSANVHPIDALLPGSGRSLYGGLIDCL